MAKELGDLIVRLSLDSSKFDDGLKRLESQMGKVQASFRSSTTGLTDFDKVTAKLQGSANTLTERLGLQKDKVAQLEAAYEESKRVKGEDAEETQKLAAKLEAARGKMNQTEQALSAVNSQIKLNQNGFYQLGVNLENVGAKFQAVGKSMTTMGTKLSMTVTAPIVALGTAAIKSSVDFESAFAGVKKTVDATDEEFQDLSNSIKEMSERIPASTTELSGIMEMAGQLGVKGSENLKKFTETIAALGVSTNLTREDAATMLAQFANITKMDLGNIDKLGSVIVALGNNFATTESDIVSMGQRLAAAGTQLGMSESQIMAFAASLSSVGIEAEAGGTAFSKLMVNMKVAAETGMQGNEVIAKTGMSLRELQMLADQDGKAFKALAGEMGMTTEELKGFMASASDLDNFAKVTGVTAEQFAKAYGEDAAGALMKFLQGLNQIDAEGGSAIVTLDEMGISEVRLRDSILRAAGATDLFTDAQELANDAWGENIALSNEAGQRYATTESQLTMLKNSANNLAIQFGDIMVPVLLKVVEKLRSLIDWMKGLSTEQKETIIKIAAIAAAAGPVLVVVGKVVSSIGTLMKVLAPLAKLLGGASASTGAFGSVLTALTGPVGIAIAAIAGLIAIFVSLYKNNEEFRDKIQALWAQICAAFENVKAVFASTFDKLKSAMQPVMEQLSALWQKTQDVFLKIYNLLEPVLAAIGVLLGGLVAAVVGVANGILNALAPLMSAIISAVDVVLSVLDIVISLLTGDFAGAWEALKATFTSLWDIVVQVFTAIGDFFVGFWDGLCAICSAFGINLSGFFSGLWEGIKSGASAAWTAFSEWISGVWTGISETASVVWSAIGTFFSELWTGIQTTASTAWAAFSTWIAGIWQGICDGAAVIWAALVTFFSGLWETISTAASTAWTSLCTTISGLWDGLKTTASETWSAVCTNIQTAVNTGKTWIQTAWTNVKTAVSGVWDTVKSTASTAWATVCTNAKTAVDNAKSGIQTAWTNISTGISTAWTTFKTTASTAWSGITSGVQTVISGAQAGIVTAWDNIKTGVKNTWDGITAIFKTPIDAVSTWLTEKVEWFKGLFNFQWKLPEFKLPKINVKWNDIGWGISLPSLSVSWNALGGIFDKATIFNTRAGLQGVGEAGPEAILPLSTLWEEMSARLRSGMLEIMQDVQREQASRDEALLSAIVQAIKGDDGNSRKSSVHVTQNIYANETSYAGQQREAARNFRQIARAMG